MNYRYNIKSGLTRVKTNTKKYFVGVLGVIASLVMVGSVALPALAASPKQTDLTGNGNNWRVFNINTAEPKLWDINKAQLDGGGLGFTFNQLSSDWFSVYLKTNYGDLTGKTITANTSWTPSALYVNRSGTSNDAHFRLEFQSAQGNYNANDYWWNTNSLNLNTASGGTLTGDLTNRGEWTNLCGKSANDQTVYSGLDCVGGTYPAVSPHDGFTSAMRNVKEVGLSFGRSASYASGVAINDPTKTATFQLNGFIVE